MTFTVDDRQRHAIIYAPKAVALNEVLRPFGKEIAILQNLHSELEILHFRQARKETFPLITSVLS